MKNKDEKWASILLDGLGKEKTLHILNDSLVKAKKAKAPKAVLESLRRVIASVEQHGKEI